MPSEALPEGTSKEEQEEEKKQDPMCSQDKASVEAASDAEENDAVEAGADSAAPKEKIRAADWPLRDIAEPHPNDVMYGRGGGTNHHPGNKLYRKMVEDRKLDYIHSKRLDKPLVALSIIREWRAQDPPGRFLKIEDKTGLWNDVGDKKAREKTSQALREKAPTLRKQEEDDKQKDSEDDEEAEDESEEKVTKSTRFAEGTNTEDAASNEAKKPVLARDHSLGREYMEAGQDVTLDGFSWQEPFQAGAPQRSVPPSSSQPPPPQAPYGQQQPPPPQGYAHTRTGSHTSVGSMGIPPQQQQHYRYPSHGSLGPPPPPPPPPGPYGGPMTSGDDRQLRYTSSGRYESWGPLPGVAQMGPPAYGYPPQHVGSWSQRENSLGQNPLTHASVSQSAPYPFDGRSGSGQWGPPPPQHGSYQPQYPPPPGGQPPPPQYQGGQQRHYSNGGPPHPPPPPQNQNIGGPPSPPYEVEPSVAQQWSGAGAGGLTKTWSGEEYDRYRTEQKVASPRTQERKDPADVPKPDVVKRMTSNQNETAETKPDLVGPSVKRAALNRDNSLASNRLKEKYLPSYKKGPFNPEREMRQLSDNLDQATLAPKPKPLSMEERMSTIDLFAMDLMVKPAPLSGAHRSSTIEALNLDLEDDPFLKPALMERTTTMEDVFADLKEGLPRPSAITGSDRLTTTDFLAIVNEPIPEY